MFRKMRRVKQLLSKEETIAVLNRGTSGVLPLCGENQYPYAVPLSYVYSDCKIYFHCATTGYKLDSIKQNNKVSFCVIDKDTVMQEEYTTYFRSAIVFGKAYILSNEQEKRQALEKLAEKYSPHNEQGRLAEIEKFFQQVCMVKIDIEHMTGKEAIELVKQKNCFCKRNDKKCIQ